MKLFLLSRLDCGYDEYDAKLIRAKNEEDAREIANECVGDEGEIWAKHSEVECEIISEDGDPSVIISSFRAG